MKSLHAIEGKILVIPCETPLQPERRFLIQAHAQLNRADFLTINSQPSVNAVPSTHETLAGVQAAKHLPPKAYYEMFCSPEQTRLADMVEGRETMNLYVVNAHGNEIKQELILRYHSVVGGKPPARNFSRLSFDSNTF
jgi:methylenetetrahydrofolate reductase (NADPH)